MALAKMIDSLAKRGKRLIQKGLVDGSTHGYVRLTLPFFGQFAAETGEER